MNKLHELRKYSDIEEVKRRGFFQGLNEIHPSSRKDKKYMVFDGRKMQHFGQMGYEDMTHHHDDRRRDLFRKRNKRWATSPVYSPAWLSYHILW